MLYILVSNECVTRGFSKNSQYNRGSKTDGPFFQLVSTNPRRSLQMIHDQPTTVVSSPALQYRLLPTSIKSPGTVRLDLSDPGLVQMT
jgi:hypothetical protein